MCCQSIGDVVERKPPFSQLYGLLLWSLFYMDSNSPPVLNALLSWHNSSSIWFIIPPFSTTNALLDCNKVSDFIHTLSNNHSAISFRVSPNAAGSHKHPISPRIRNNHDSPAICSHSPISSARITPLSWTQSNSRNNDESSHGIMNTRIQEYCLLISPTHLQPIPTFNTTIEHGFEVSFFSWSFRGNPLYPQRNGCFGKAQPFTFALRFLQFTMQVIRLFQ